MREIREILPSYLDTSSDSEKKAFFKALYALAGADGNSDDGEIRFINAVAAEHDIKISEEMQYPDTDTLLQEVSVIKNRKLALELIREMCLLSHIDNVLSDSETLIIGKVGLAMGVELEKIEEISNWIIDRIVWLEQAKIIFEEE